MSRKTSMSVGKFSVNVAARLLGIAPNTLRTLTNTGRIECERAYNGDRLFDPVVIYAEQLRRADKRRSKKADL